MTPSRSEIVQSRLAASIGVESPPGEWHTIAQDQIDAFARATLDEQFIHVDPIRAARESPFGRPIAHGFLTLSLLVHLVKSIPAPANDPLADCLMGINYGLDRARFPAPVPVGSRVRARRTLLVVEAKDDRTVQLTHRVTVEIEGQAKPACSADWLTRAILA